VRGGTAAGPGEDVPRDSVASTTAAAARATLPTAATRRRFRAVAVLSPSIAVSLFPSSAGATR
jgi:hypothetical protein